MNRAWTIVAVVMIALAIPAAASAGSRPCHGDRFRTDGVPAAVERRNAQNVIRCVFNRVAPGQVSKALYVAERESGFNDEASNGGAYLGLFQHAARYWGSRTRMLPDRVFAGSPGPFNAQANAWVSAIMVRRGGWGPWSTA